ncbi:MAG: AsmA family protein [Burkholderiaceae bacterium]
MTSDTPEADRRPPKPDSVTHRPAAGRVTRVAVGSLVVLVAAVAVGEWAGWPFLGQPVQHWLSDKLGRTVQLSSSDAGAQSAHFRFVGGVRVDAPLLRIAAPSWQDPSAAPTVQATDVHLALRYIDLWRAWRQGDVRIKALTATTLDALLERRSDGRATWQFDSAAKPDHAGKSDMPGKIPTIGSLKVEKGTVHWIDPQIDADITAQLALTSQSANTHAGAGETGAAQQFKATAKGQLRKLPVNLELRADGALPLVSQDTSDTTQLHLDGQWGTSSLEFDGKAVDVLRASNISGRFLIKGPSLASVGDPFGVTLPTTPPFRAVGQVARLGQEWNVVFNDATVGVSKLKGAFVYDAAPPIPTLSGRLNGERLYLSDLAPSVGAGSDGPKKRAGDRVLPDKSFDLPSLRVMRANVLIDVQEVDLNTKLLEPLRPLRAHLVLTDGILRIDAIDARTAQGRLQGKMQLDGRQDQALWSTDLRWSGVELSQWIHQDRPGGAPPYVSGKLDGSAQWTGRGKSTAQILGSLNGPMRVFLRQGRVSHLAVEVAGIDVFQSLGLLISGDERLNIRCGAAEMMATDGSIRPTVFVIDTSDSVVLVDGSLSLAKEAMDLRAVVTPKDFSLLSLRSPLRVQGSFSNPRVSIEPTSIGAKLAGSVLLGLINPLAALIPLIDPGDADASNAASAECKSLAGRIASRQPARRGVQPDR